MDISGYFKMSLFDIMRVNCIVYLFSGFGGQIDFIRGAALSLDGEGKPIIACTSTTENGTSRIVSMLKLGMLIASISEYCPVSKNGLY